MGCLKSIFYQIGCFVLIVATACLGWIYREQVVAVYHKLRGTPPRADAVYVAPAPGGAESARGALERLERGGGPAYVDLSPAELAALIDAALARSGRRVFDSVQVGLADGEVRVRGSLDLSGVPRDMLGPLRGAVLAREPVEIGGPLSADSSGRLMLTVTRLVVKDFPFPRATIGRLLDALKVPGAEGGRVPLPGPPALGDVRVDAGSVRFYRRAA